MSVSVSRSALNLLKAYLGTGLLAVPFAVSCAGLWLGMVFIGVLTFLSNHTMKLLVRMALHTHRTRGEGSLLHRTDGDSSADTTLQSLVYEDLGEAACGQCGRSLASWAKLLTNVGIVVGYMIFVGDTFLSMIQVARYPAPRNSTDAVLDPVVLSGSGGGSEGMRFNLLLLGLVPLCGGLGMLKTMKKLSFVSILGNISIIVAIIVVMYSSSAYVVKHGPAPNLVSANPGLLPEFFGIALFSFALHGVVLEIILPMEKVEERAYSVMDGVAFSVGIIYCAFGGLGYVVFGDSVQASILDNMPEHTPAERTVKVGTCFAMGACIALSLPLFNFAIFRAIEDALGWASESISPGQAVQNRPGDVAYSLIESSTHGGEGLRVPHLVPGRSSYSTQRTSSCYKRTRVPLLRVFIVCCLVFVAMLLGKLFGDIIGFVGAFTMSTVAFIFPAYYFIRIMWNEQTTTLWDKFLAVSIFVGGFGAMIISTFMAVKKVAHDV